MSTELTYLLYDLMKLLGSLMIMGFVIWCFYYLNIKPKRKAKKLYLKVLEQYSPLGALRIWIQYEGK